MACLVQTPPALCLPPGLRCCSSHPGQRLLQGFGGHCSLHLETPPCPPLPFLFFFGKGYFILLLLQYNLYIRKCTKFKVRSPVSFYIILYIYIPPVEIARHQLTTVLTSSSQIPFVCSCELPNVLLCLPHFLWGLIPIFQVSAQMAPPPPLPFHSITLSIFFFRALLHLQFLFVSLFTVFLPN